jgi:hypothetical protein
VFAVLFSFSCRQCFVEVWELEILYSPGLIAFLALAEALVSPLGVFVLVDTVVHERADCFDLDSKMFPVAAFRTGNVSKAIIVGFQTGMFFDQLFYREFPCFFAMHRINETVVFFMKRLSLARQLA